MTDFIKRLSAVLTLDDALRFVRGKDSRTEKWRLGKSRTRKESVSRCGDGVQGTEGEKGK